jgi:hypothetical protein
MYSNEAVAASKQYVGAGHVGQLNTGYVAVEIWSRVTLLQPPPLYSSSESTWHTSACPYVIISLR